MHDYIITTIEHHMNRDRYTALVNGQLEGISWYGKQLSPEGKPADTLYLLELETNRDVGTFLMWHITAILGSLPLIKSAPVMYEALKHFVSLADKYELKEVSVDFYKEVTSILAQAEKEK